LALRLDTTKTPRRIAAITVATLKEVRQLPEWKRAFSHLAKDWRYYEIVQETINPEFDYRYLVVRNSDGKVLAIQPFFLVHQDILQGSNTRLTKFAENVRKIWPGFLKIRTLMVGNAAGPGYLQPTQEEERVQVARILSKNLIPLGKLHRSALVVLKEFPRFDRNALSELLAEGFSLLPSLPHTQHDLSRFASFDDYKEAKNRNGRRRIERHLKASTNPGVAPIQLEVRDSGEGAIDEIYELYEKTFERASMSFERLTPEYFREIGRRMPDRARFFFWRQNGKIIAASLCLIEGDTLLTEYLGLDYTVANDLKLYFRVHYDTIDWAIKNGFKSLVSTPLGYEPKLYLGHELLPVDLYVAQTFSSSMNSFFKWMASKIDPTVNDPVLERFPNFRELRTESKKE